MKLRRKVAAGIAVLLVISIAAVLHAFNGNPARRALNQTRRELRAQGFKTDIKDFNLRLTPEESRRASMMARTTRASLTNRALPWQGMSMGPISSMAPGGLNVVTPNAALVTWQAPLSSPYAQGRDGWPDLQAASAASQAALGQAREAALAGPIRFEPIGFPNPLLPYAADLRQLSTVLWVETLLALREGNHARAWTNLLAGTCLVTEYRVEPIEVSHLVRAAYSQTAFNATWNALQRHDWSDAELAELQRRWESLDLWSGVSEIPAFQRVDMAAVCQMERTQGLGGGPDLKYLLRSPSAVWSMINQWWSQARYHRSGSYEDERAILLYYRDRELELRQALQCKTWAEMRMVPNITNPPPFVSTRPSRLGSMLNLRQLNTAAVRMGQGMVGRLAEAEARRRILICALAAERHRVLNGAYPESLRELVPCFLKTVPADIMNGQGLHYRKAGVEFVLYSVGLDLTDNGGEMRNPRLSDPFGGSGFPSAGGFDFAARGRNTDIVWPRSATEQEAAAAARLESQRAAIGIEHAAELEASDRWTRLAWRQSHAAKILAGPPPVTPDPLIRGKRLTELLGNNEAPGTNRLTLGQMLTLNTVPTPLEPERLTFDFPIRYSALTNVGELFLAIDPLEEEDSEEGRQVALTECTPTENGNARLTWSTIFEPPGRHALEAAIYLNDEVSGLQVISGPPAPVVISNVCQFSASSAYFNPQLGGTFRALLLETNASYTIEVRTLAGQTLRTLKGATTNGVLVQPWDLTDDAGRRCTNSAYDTVFHLHYPDSRKTVTFRGP